MPRFVAFALACVLATPCARAAVSTWSGAADTAFANASNWNALPADDLLTDVATFTGTPTANQPRLAANRSVTGLVFSTTTGGWTLSAASRPTPSRSVPPDSPPPPSPPEPTPSQPRSPSPPPRPSKSAPAAPCASPVLSVPAPPPRRSPVSSSSAAPAPAT